LVIIKENGLASKRKKPRQEATIPSAGDQVDYLISIKNTGFSGLFSHDSTCALTPDGPGNILQPSYQWRSTRVTIVRGRRKSVQEIVTPPVFSNRRFRGARIRPTAAHHGSSREGQLTSVLGVEATDE
jgi:hypothetical protein